MSDNEAISDQEKWHSFCAALDEGKVSIILEGADDSIDGGVIVTCADDMLDHIGFGAKSTPILPDQSPAYCESGGCACSEIFERSGACL